MTATTFKGHFLGPDIHANRPSASGLPESTMYVCTTHNKIERIVSGSWTDYAVIGSSTGAYVATDTIWDTKGDLAAATGADAASKLAAGTNNKVLTADSSQSTGLKWQFTKDIEVKIFDDATAVTTGENKLVICIPTSLGGCDLTAVAAFVSTNSSSGLPSVGVRNVTTANEMLSTNITIDANEATSYTAATPPVIDGSHKSVSTGDLIAIDVDGAGTGAKGLGVILTFSLP
jgi:hypothetical protein